MRGGRASSGASVRGSGPRAGVRAVVCLGAFRDSPVRDRDGGLVDPLPPGWLKIAFLGCWVSAAAAAAAVHLPRPLRPKGGYRPFDKRGGMGGSSYRLVRRTG